MHCKKIDCDTVAPSMSKLTYAKAMTERRPLSLRINNRQDVNLGIIMDHLDKLAFRSRDPTAANVQLPFAYRAFDKFN
jgi:hypothetical protein